MANTRIAQTCSVENCGKRVVAWGWCDTHYRRWKKTGDVTKTKFLYWQSIHDDGFAEYFWLKVNKDGPTQPHMSTPCWEWQQGRETAGYGTIRVNKRHYKAHRLSWELANGREPVLDILHHCDNPPCCNPDHLYEGTDADNVRDCMERGRHRVPVGEECVRRKGTNEIVRQIRALKGMDSTTVIKVLNLDMKKCAVWRIQTGKTWKHLL